MDGTKLREKGVNSLNSRSIKCGEEDRDKDTEHCGTQDREIAMC